MNAMQKTFFQNGFTVVVQATEIANHEASVVAFAKRGGRVIGRSRIVRTDLTKLGLLAIEKDSNVKKIVDFAVPLALNDARINLHRMVVEMKPLSELVAA